MLLAFYQTGTMPGKSIVLLSLHLLLLCQIIMGLMFPAIQVAMARLILLLPLVLLLIHFYGLRELQVKT